MNAVLEAAMDLAKGGRGLLSIRSRLVVAPDVVATRPHNCAAGAVLGPFARSAWRRFSSEAIAALLEAWLAEACDDGLAGVHAAGLGARRENKAHPAEMAEANR